MSEYNRIPVTKSSPIFRGTVTGSVRSYDSNVMELFSEADDDDGGFKSLPDYALARIFSAPKGHGSYIVKSDSVPGITMTPGSPETPTRKKRRAPDPPLSLIGARAKFPSSDDIVEKKKFLAKKEKAKSDERPLSFTPGKKSVALWDELLDKLYNSPSPEPSPRSHRARNIIQKLRSPRLARSQSRKRSDKISRLDEEAGFKPGNLSNSSSIDETDGPDVGLQFGILCRDLERDAEFEVKCI